MQYTFMIEKYRDVHNTLEQAIEIPCDMPEEEFHRCRAFLRTQINPNLTWLYEVIYLDSTRKPLYWDKFDINGNLIKREEPWLFDGNKNKYSKGGEIK